MISIAGRPVAEAERDQVVDASVGPAALAVVLLPLLRPTAGPNLAPVDLVIALALGAALLSPRLRREPTFVPYAVSMLTFVVAGGLGALSSTAVSRSAAGLALVQDVWLLLWGAVVAQAAATPGGLRVVLRAWCASSIAWAGVLIVAVLTGTTAVAGITARNGTRAALTLGDPNYAANYFVVSFLLVVAAGYPSRSWLRRSGLVLILVALALTGSNGGVLTFGIGVAVVGVWSVWRRRGAAAACVLICALGLFGLTQHASCSERAPGRVAWGACLVHPSAIEQWAHNSNIKLLKDGLGRGDKSTEDRKELVSESLDLYRADGSLLGLAPTAIKPSLAQRQVPFVKEAHNDYIAAIIERGALGALALVMLLGAAAWRLTGVTERTLPRAYRDVIRKPEAIVAAMLVMAIEGWVYEVLHTRHLWALLGIVAGVHRSSVEARSAGRLREAHGRAT